MDSVPPDPPGLDPATAAFARLADKVELLEAAVTGLAARREALPDYSATLGDMTKRLGTVGQALGVIADKPAMQLTPDALGREIGKAGTSVRDADHRTIRESTAQLDQAIGRINGMVESALTADRQKVWMAWAAAGGMAFGIMLWSILPGSLARAVPENWHWPERMAAHMLAMDGWAAGERLMRIADADRWKALASARKLVEDNAAALETCEKQRQKARVEVSCKIQLTHSPESQSIR